MPPVRRHDYNGKRRSLKGARLGAPTLIMLILAIASLPTCSRLRDPQSAYDHALQTYQHGDVKAALAEARKGYDGFHAVSSEWRWKFRILQASALVAQQRSKEALTLLTSEPGPPSSGDLGVQLQRVEGVAYAGTRNFLEAQKRLTNAERLCIASDGPACSSVVLARSWVDGQLGDFESGRKLLGQALDSARKNGNQFLEATALVNLSWSALQLAHLDEVLDWGNDALQIAVPRDFAGIAQKALGNMGWASYRLGDPEKAAAMFLGAKAQAAKLGNTADELTWILDNGYVHLDNRDYAAAEQSFRQSFDLAEKIPSREGIVNALQSLAFVCEQTGRLDEAKRYADDALSMAQADKNGRDIVYARLVQGRVAARLHDTAPAESNFRFAEESKDTPVFLKWEAERSLARLYEDENQRDSAEREYRTALTTFETARSELKHEDSRLPFLSNAARIYDDYVHFLVAQGKSAEALQVADYSRGRTLAEGLGLLQKGTSFNPDRMGAQGMDAQGVARRAGGTIFFYWLGEKQSYLWAVTPQKTNLFALPPGAEIDAAVQRYREALAGPQDVLASADRDGQSLFRMLIAPAQALLKKDAKVFIIPDGSLNNLNFETLIVSDSVTDEAKLPEAKPSSPKLKLHYWIEDVTIANASSLRILGASGPNKNRNKEKRSRNLLLVGNSVAPNAKYPQLAQAAAQMESVARHFPAAEETIFAQQAATPSAYLDGNPERFSYIHFVAHGTASRLSPLDSAIVLSKASAEDDSFKLYARDIIRHPLRADLVTISACYSSGERAYSGEGLVGLSWAFLRAGAHNVIAALWEATDTSTELLMDKFYDELQAGKSPDAALRAAKLSLLHNSGFHNPFYWAPFQLYARLG
jgi:CHAT domain-containing protein